ADRAGDRGTRCARGERGAPRCRRRCAVRDARPPRGARCPRSRRPHLAPPAPRRPDTDAARLRPRLGRAPLRRRGRHAGGLPLGADQRRALRALRLRGTRGDRNGAVRAVLSPRLSDRPRLHAADPPGAGPRGGSRRVRRERGWAVTAYARWERDGWRGVARPALELDVAAVARMVDGAGRASPHARTLPVTAAGDRLFFLDNDRTRRSRLLVAVGARRNLVQLGRFVVPGLTLTDRARVLDAYARGRRLSRRRRRRLARWLVAKTTARRCAVDRIPEATARQNGFRELMRSGGPFDRAD